jgi:hypothetical protein
MCYGYDGEAALRRSLAQKGASRRGLFRAAGGVALGGAALATTGAPAAAAAAARGPVRDDRVKHDRISIQLYTLRAAMSGEPGPATVLERLAQYGYQKVERAGFYPAFPDAPALKAKLDALGIRASSSHDGISASVTALQSKLENARILGQEYVVVPYLNSSSRSEWETWADQMNAEAALARRWGLKYGYHNHAH